MSHQRTPGRRTVRHGSAARALAALLSDRLRLHAPSQICTSTYSSVSGEPWASRIQACLKSIQTTGTSVSTQLNITNTTVAKYGNYPLLSVDVILKGPTSDKKSFSWQKSLAPYNNTPKKVTFDNLPTGDYQLCVDLQTK